jgi:tetraacyldisaccharide 4'-kinase
MLPLVPLYAAGAALRAAGLRLGLRPVRRLQWPVLSVGNLSVGGTGKTPFTIALAKLLGGEGMHVDVLSRGYGRTDPAAVLRVDPSGSAEQFGDEPLLLANAAGIPVYVAAERWMAGQLAEKEAAESVSEGEPHGVHLLDDGFQHRQLARDLDIVLVNSADLGDSLLPAGNLREGLDALKRAHVLAVQEGDELAMRQLQHLGFGPRKDRQIWRYRREMTGVEPLVNSEADGVGPRVAFCGIGRPEQFFSGLAKQGVKIGASRTFPDHHRYTAEDMDGLRQLAESTHSRALVTTAKDLFRVGSLAKGDVGGPQVLAVDLRVVLEDDAEIAAFLRKILPRSAPA